MAGEMLVQTFGILLNSLPYFVLCYMPVWEDLRVPKRMILLIMGFFAVLQAVSILAIMAFVEDWAVYRAPHSLISTLLYMAVYLISAKAKPFNLLFIVLITKCYADTVTTLAKFFELTYFPPANGESFQLAFNAFHLLLLVVTLPFMAVLMLKKVRLVINSEVRAWKFIWAIPLTLYGMNLSFSTLNLSLIKTVQFAIFDSFLLVGSYIIYSITIEMLIKTKTSAENEERARRAQDILSIQIRQYQNLSDSIEASRRLNHDMRHQLALLNELAAQDSVQAVREYLAQMTTQISSLKRSDLCENFAVNALLCYYARLCEENGIQFDCRVALQNDLPLSDSILCMLFGNCVENAIEACNRIPLPGSRKFIDLTAAVDGTSLILSMENSSSGKARKSGEVFLSDKREDAVGIGLSSVKTLAEKHAGFAEFSETGCVFSTKVLLNMAVRQETLSLV